MSGPKKGPGRCIFCLSTAKRFSKVEHIIPESLSGDELMPAGWVCDSCNAYFGAEVEEDALRRSPVGFLRSFHSIPSKKGRYAEYEGFRFVLKGGEDRVPKVWFHPDKMKATISAGRGHLLLNRLGMGSLTRLLLKIGLELVAVSGKADPYMKEFDPARRAARFPKRTDTWDLAETAISPEDVRETGEDEQCPFERKLVYSFDLGYAESRGLIVLAFQYFWFLYCIPLTEGDFPSFIQKVHQSNPGMKEFDVNSVNLVNRLTPRGIWNR